MQAVGTMHTWPTLLASITWIVELLTYDEEVQSAQAGQDPALAAADDERAEEKLLFEYLGTAYKAFLDGDDDRYAELEQGFVGTFEGRCREVEAQCEAIEANVATMREQIQACYQRRCVRACACVCVFAF
jgi:kinetochore protein NDC80